MTSDILQTSTAEVTIHRSQFPDQVQRDLADSLRTRKVNHKFHYDSPKQTQKWLALHQQFSPSRTDPGCSAVYDRAFAACVEQFRGKLFSPGSSESQRGVNLIGIGCGGGRKDAQLLTLLTRAGTLPRYSPCDVSTSMVLVARNTALTAIPTLECDPWVFDLANADNLPELFDSRPQRELPRIITFFGMIPNFEPGAVLNKLANLIRPGDWLLFSANLSPGPDYLAGLQKILPQYDNTPTREWLMTFLLDLGVENGDGEIQVCIEPGAPGDGAGRILASFRFRRRVNIRIGIDQFEFAPGEMIRLFFSYRYTPSLIRDMLGRVGMNVRQEFITASGEEGVFLCGR